MQLPCGDHPYCAEHACRCLQVDIILSNCVVNLSPDKRRVLAEAFRVLRPGGEFYFSDVYADRRVPADAQSNEVRSLTPFLTPPSVPLALW